MHRRNRPLVGLLRQVIGVASIAQIPAELPHIGLGLGHEAFERATITIAGVYEQSS
jgi:hypothetical protein